MPLAKTFESCYGDMKGELGFVPLRTLSHIMIAYLDKPGIVVIDGTMVVTKYWKIQVHMNV